MFLRTALGRVPMLALGLLVALGLGGGGCFSDQDVARDELKEPQFLEGKRRMAAYNYQGAAEAFEQALVSNPKSASAHYELGLLCYEKLNDHPAAIYHFQKFLKLRPDWKQADTIQQFINVSKVELAKTAPLGPQTPHVQREIDRLTSKQLELTGENTRLRQQVQYLASLVQQYAQQSGTRPSGGPWPTNAPPVPLPMNPPEGGTVFPSPSPAPGPGARADSAAHPPPSRPPSPAPPSRASVGRSYTVRSGDTMAAIARRHGLSLEALRNANPTVTPHRIKPGQTLRLPAL